MDLHGDALGQIAGDMDDMESKKMMPSDGGATITITVSPGGDEYPEGHDISMCKGGCAMHKGGEVSDDAEGLPGDDLAMADGGQVPQAVPMPDESSVPPFLRKRKGI